MGKRSAAEGSRTGPANKSARASAATTGSKNVVRPARGSATSKRQAGGPPARPASAKSVVNKREAKSAARAVGRDKLSAQKAGGRSGKNVKAATVAESDESSEKDSEEEEEVPKVHPGPKRSALATTAKKLVAAVPESRGQQDSSAKREKVKRRRKMDKAVLARRKLERMRKLGFLSPPPRRSASLTASAIVTCMLDSAHNRQKTEAATPEVEPTATHSGQILFQTKSEPSSTQTKLEQTEENPDKQRSQAKSDNSHTQVKLQREKPKAVKRQGQQVLPVKVEPKDEEEKKKEKMVSLKRSTFKKTKKALGKSAAKNRFQGEIKDLIVGRRVASMNASAMMTATYGQKWVSKNPLKLAIELSLKEAKEREETREGGLPTVVPVSSSADADWLATREASSSAAGNPPVLGGGEHRETPPSVERPAFSGRATAKPGVVLPSGHVVGTAGDQTARPLGSPIVTVVQSGGVISAGGGQDGKPAVQPAAGPKAADSVQLPAVTASNPDGSRPDGSGGNLAGLTESAIRLRLIENASARIKKGRMRRRSSFEKKRRADAALREAALTEVPVKEVSVTEAPAKKETGGTEDNSRTSAVPKTQTSERSGGDSQRQQQPASGPSHKASSLSSATAAPPGSAAWSPATPTVRNAVPGIKGRPPTTLPFPLRPGGPMLAGRLPAGVACAPVQAAHLAVKTESRPAAPSPFVSNLRPATSHLSSTLSSPSVYSASSSSYSTSSVSGSSTFLSSSPNANFSSFTSASGAIRLQSPPVFPTQHPAGCLTAGRGGGVPPPTATVPPTLMPARSVPVAADMQGASYPSSVYGTAASVYSAGYMQSVPSTVYSTGYVQSVPPQQFYSDPQQQQPQPQQPQQFPGGYSYSYPAGYSLQGYSPHQGTAKPPTVTQLYNTPGGYYIAGTAVMPGTTVGKGSGSGSSTGPPSQGYIYGAYGAYPYGSGRVIGPIIAIAPGTVPLVPSPTGSTLELKTEAIAGSQEHQQPLYPQLQPSAPPSSAKVRLEGSKPHGAAAPMMAGAITTTASASAVAAISSVAAPVMTTGVTKRAPFAEAERGGQVVVEPTMALLSKAEPAYRAPAPETAFKLLNDSSYRQILPKSGGKQKELTESPARPLQVVGPIGTSGLVAAVPPTQLQPNPALVVSRMALPERFMFNGQAVALPAMAATPNRSAFPPTKPGEIRLLDEARKRLLAKNNVSIFQKSKTATLPTAVNEAGKERRSSTDAANSGAGVSTPSRDWRDCPVKPAEVLPLAPVRLPLKIPRLPAPRLFLPPRPPAPGQLPAARVECRIQTGSAGVVRPAAVDSVSVVSSGGTGNGAEASCRVSESWSDRNPATSGGHPGLPSGLMRMASSVIPATKSPTKIAARAEGRPAVAWARSSLAVEARRANLDLLLASSVPASSSSTSRADLEGPPVLSPQVLPGTKEAIAASRLESPALLQSQARQAANAVLKSVTKPRSPAGDRKTSSSNTSDRSPRARPMGQKQERRRLIREQQRLQQLEVAGERSRLQLKPATSPKLSLEKYPVVEAAGDPLRTDGSEVLTSVRTTLSQERSKSSRKEGRVRGGSASAAQPLVPWSSRSKEAPKNSGGWSWKGEPTLIKVYLNNEEQPVERICYPSIRHEEGDEEVQVKDCILLASGNRKKDLPFIAKVTALWENPEDGEMMMSLLWFYRPEHTDIGRQPEDCLDEVFASRHRDHTSVACIEDKCYVMTNNEYCRYQKFCKMMDSGVAPPWNIVPEREEGYPRARLLPACQVAADRVFLCRKVYDLRGKRMIKNPY